ncbi:hypothetical protein BGX33_010085 [Mortierella sp. NVP41]|nr:hypothetical protein BGX33_010085 [Mortierella sp. NVP41]
MLEKSLKEANARTSSQDLTSQFDTKSIIRTLDIMANGRVAELMRKEDANKPADSDDAATSLDTITFHHCTQDESRYQAQHRSGAAFERDPNCQRRLTGGTALRH